MKAKLFEFNGEAEIVFDSQDLSFTMDKGEEVEDFMSRISDTIAEVYEEEMQLSMVDTTKIKKKASAQLKKAYEKASGLEAKIIADILQGRDIEVEVKSEETTEETTEEKPKNHRKAADRVPLKEELEKLRDESKANVGKRIAITPHGNKPRVDGTIKGIMIDKRTDSVYYRIDGKDGKLYHKRVNSDQLSIDHGEN